MDRPDLRNRPVAVCGDPEGRHGIILAKNQIAKGHGVQTAETIWQARKKCPDLVLLPPHFEKYRYFHKKLNELFLEYTDMVEPFSIDESWLDVTGSRRLFGTGREIADSIRERAKKELGLTLSAGVSYNKIFAKMGSEYKKPDATTEITRENYKTILWPLPVGEFFFVGSATADKLMELGIQTIGDLALADANELMHTLGKQGPLLSSYARGEDTDPVSPYGTKRKIKSVGNGITFRRDLISRDDILTALISLSDTVAGRLRAYELKAGGIKVDIKDTGLKTISRQKPLSRPTDLAEDIRAAAMELVESSWTEGRPIRLLTVTGINLSDGSEGEQLSLFTSDGLLLSPEESLRKSEESASLERTMDAIRSKFGGDSITYGKLIGNDIGIDI